MTDSHSPTFARVRVDSAGRVVIPADVRQHLGIEAGQELILCGESQGIRLQTFQQAARAAQQAFAPFRPAAGASVVDELIRERREEARREYGE